MPSRPSEHAGWYFRVNICVHLLRRESSTRGCVSPVGLGVGEPAHDATMAMSPVWNFPSPHAPAGSMTLGTDCLPAGTYLGAERGGTKRVEWVCCFVSSVECTCLCFVAVHLQAVCGCAWGAINSSCAAEPGAAFNLHARPAFSSPSETHTANWQLAQPEHSKQGPNLGRPLSVPRYVVHVM